MRVLIVDELHKIRHRYIEQISNLDLITSFVQCFSAEDAVYEIIDSTPDLVITSEVLPYRNGFSIANFLHKLNKKTPVIIVTKDALCAIDAIKSKVFDYVLDCENDFTLVKAVKNAAIYLQDHYASKNIKSFEKNIKIRIGHNNGYKLVHFDSLAYCLADGSYTKLCYIDNTNDMSSIYLAKITQILAKYHFVRINRSVVANLKYISKIDKFKLICMMEYNNQFIEFKLGRSYLEKLESEKII